MRLKTWVAKEAAHRDLVTCVGWSNAEEAFSCGDDHAFMRWNLVTNESDKVCDLPGTLYPTDLHWFPRVPGTATKKQGTDVALVTSADGKFHLVNRNGRVEKSVEAHKGATLSGRWSFDGTSLLTAGEDGQVKIWSRGGMLRSTVVQAGSPVYCAVWGPDSNQVLYTLDRSLVVKPLAPNSKANRWKAHEGLILKVAWNPSNNLIISGGEDCRYKVRWCSPCAGTATPTSWLPSRTCLSPSGTTPRSPLSTGGWWRRPRWSRTPGLLVLSLFQTISSKPLRAAEVSLLGGNPHEAESVLLQNGLTYRAIDMHLRMHNWNRALEVAVKHKSHVDTVLYQRRKYLASMAKGEKNEKFLQFKEMELDEEKILTKMKLESEKEL